MSRSKFTKKQLAQLYKSKSIAEIAAELDVAKSTVHYYLKKFNIQTRDRSTAQKAHIERHSHQRLGSKHSDAAKTKISQSSRDYWDSRSGNNQKKKLAQLRKREWRQSSKNQRGRVVSRLNNAARPEPGTLSKFGNKLCDFLSGKELSVKSCIALTEGHISDIVLEDRKVVLELVIPAVVYGSEAEDKLARSYTRLVNRLHSVGYRVVIVEDVSNSISNARCERLYDRLTKFFKGKRKTLRIES